MYTTESEGGTRENVLTIHRAADRERPRSARVPSERSRSLPRHYQQNRLSRWIPDSFRSALNLLKKLNMCMHSFLVLCNFFTVIHRVSNKNLFIKVILVLSSFLLLCKFLTFIIIISNKYSLIKVIAVLNSFLLLYQLLTIILKYNF